MTTLQGNRRKIERSVIIITRRDLIRNEHIRETKKLEYKFKVELGRSRTKNASKTQTDAVIVWEPRKEHRDVKNVEVTCVSGARDLRATDRQMWKEAEDFRTT